MSELRNLVRYAEAIRKRHSIPGIAFGAARGERHVFEGGVGWRDAGERAPIGIDTVVGVGSITKSLTALAIMQLSEVGRLDINDPVQKWLPEFTLQPEVQVRRMTLHHFLTHTAGLPPLPSRFYAQYRSIAADPNRDRIPLPVELSQLRPIDTYEDLMQLLSEFDIQLLGEPGEYFSYCNEAYGLLGCVIERASGRSYPEYIRENILEPARMTRTVFAPEDVQKLRPDVSQIYSSRVQDGETQVFAAPGYWEKHAMYACGHLKSTVRDMLQYSRVYRGGGRVDGQQIASPQSINAMMTPHVHVGRGQYYGYGLGIQPDYQGATVIKHGGGDKGVSAHLCFVCGYDLAACSLANLAGVPSENVGMGALNAMLDVPVDEPPEQFPEYPLGEAQLERFAGTYSSGEGARLECSVKDGELWVKAQGVCRAAQPFAPDSVVVQINRDMRVPLHFLFDTKGEVWAVSMGRRIVTRCPG